MCVCHFYYRYSVVAWLYPWDINKTTGPENIHRIDAKAWCIWTFASRHDAFEIIFSLNLPKNHVVLKSNVKGGVIPVKVFLVYCIIKNFRDRMSLFFLLIAFGKWLNIRAVFCSLRFTELLTNKIPGWFVIIVLLYNELVPCENYKKKKKKTSSIIYAVHSSREDLCLNRSHKSPSEPPELDFTVYEWVSDWKSLSLVQLFATSWTIQFTEFSRLEYWSA